MAFFSRALRRARNIASCFEFGANIGLNLRCLSQLLPTAALSGIEINSDAVAELRKWMELNGGGEAVHGSILEWEPTMAVDLVLVKGVLIHIAPEHLTAVYEKLYRMCKRYVLLAEYYNPTPVSVPYRGHSERLYKRDFAGDMLDRFSDLKLLDYGFFYRRDPMFPMDDMTWFLLERS